MVGGGGLRDISQQQNLNLKAQKKMQLLGQPEYNLFVICLDSILTAKYHNTEICSTKTVQILQDNMVQNYIF